MTTHSPLTRDEFAEAIAGALPADRRDQFDRLRSRTNKSEVDIAKGLKEVAESMQQALLKIHRGREQTLRALDGFYRLLVICASDPSSFGALRKALGNEAELRTSGKPMNAVVKAVLGVKDRKTASRLAQVLLFGLGNGVKPERFSQFVTKKGGIEKAANAYSRIVRGVAPAAKAEDEAKRPVLKTLRFGKGWQALARDFKLARKHKKPVSLAIVAELHPDGHLDLEDLSASSNDWGERKV